MLNAFIRAPDGVRTSQARLTSNDVSRRREVVGGFAPPPFSRVKSPKPAIVSGFNGFFREYDLNKLRFAESYRGVVGH